MTQLTLSTVCMIATLAAAPALAESPGHSDDRRPARQPECTDSGPKLPAQGRMEGRTARKDEPMDCIVVWGHPDQDGRAVLRRSLEEEAKKGISRAAPPSLKLSLPRLNRPS